MAPFLIGGDSMFVDGVEVENNVASDTDEIRWYIHLLQKEVDIPIAKLKISRADDKHVKLEYESFERKFERIRRITGRDARKVA